MWFARREAYIRAGQMEQAADAAAYSWDAYFMRADLAKKISDRIRQEIFEEEGKDPGVPVTINIDNSAGHVAVIEWPARGY